MSMAIGLQELYLNLHDIYIDPTQPGPSDKFTMHLRSPGEYFMQGIISGIYGEHNKCHLVPDLKETVYLSEGTDSDI